MQQLTVNIPDNKIGFLIDLAAQHGFTVESNTKRNVLTQKQIDLVNEMTVAQYAEYLDKKGIRRGGRILQRHAEEGNLANLPNVTKVEWIESPFHAKGGYYMLTVKEPVQESKKTNIETLGSDMMENPISNPLFEGNDAKAADSSEQPTTAATLTYLRAGGYQHGFPEESTTKKDALTQGQFDLANEMTVAQYGEYLGKKGIKRGVRILQRHAQNRNLENLPYVTKVEWIESPFLVVGGCYKLTVEEPVQELQKTNNETLGSEMMEKPHNIPPLEQNVEMAAGEKQPLTVPEYIAYLRTLGDARTPTTISQHIAAWPRSRRRLPGVIDVQSYHHPSLPTRGIYLVTLKDVSSQNEL